MTSIIIIAHQQCESLSSNLPALLSQQGTDYEVVVVDMNSDDDTIDCLKALAERHHHLHYLSLPTSARDISHERLALHLGMRAALYENVLVMNATSTVPHKQWLCQVEQRWRTDCDIMLIPFQRHRKKAWIDVNAGHEAWQGSLYARQARYQGLFRQSACIVGLNKQLFLGLCTPAHVLALKTGTMDIFVAQVANKYNTIRLTEQELFVQEDSIPSRRLWAQKRLFHAETNSHLPHSVRRRLSYLLHSLASIHRGSLCYIVMDMIDYLRWKTTKKSTFVKKHY